MGYVLLDRRSGKPIDPRYKDDPELPAFDDIMHLKAGGYAPPRLIPIQTDPGDGLEHIYEGLEQAKERPGIRAYTRNKHYMGVRTTTTAATLRIPAVNLWNPAAAAMIVLYEVWCVNTTATSYNVSMARTTARGTQTTTVAAAAANSIENDVASPAGVAIDTAWSVNPTVNAADLIRWIVPATIGNGFILQFPDPIRIPFGTGMALIAATALAFQASDVTFVWGD